MTTTTTTTTTDRSTRQNHFQFKSSSCSTGILFPATTTRTRRVAAALVVVAASSTNASEITTACGANSDRNNKPYDERILDNGCTVTNPICVDANHQKVSVSNNKEETDTPLGNTCVPCINYYEYPNEPDWGCTQFEPLCVTATTTDNNEDTTETIHNGNCENGLGDDSNYKRPLFGHAGTTCIPYPCHNTKTTLDDNNGDTVDEGCTLSHPICVDALDSNPPYGQPGMKCISISSFHNKRSIEHKTTLPKECNCSKQKEICDCSITSTRSKNMEGGWGLGPRRIIKSLMKRNPKIDSQETQANNHRLCGLMGGAAAQAIIGNVDPNTIASAMEDSTTTTCSSSEQIVPVSFCNGCPFDQGTKCGLSSTTATASSTLSW